MAGKKNKLIRWVNRLFLFILMFIILAGSIVFFVAKYREDAIENLIIEQINKTLTAEITYRTFDFDPWSNFPKVSFYLNELYCVGYKGNPEMPLIDHGNVAVLFDAWQIITGNFTIQDILISDASLHILLFGDGNSNYQIFKDNEESTHASILLEKITIKNTHIRFINNQNHFDLALNAKNLQLSGSLEDKGFHFKTKGDLYINHMDLNKMSYIIEKNLDFSLQLLYQNEHKKTVISEADVIFEGVPMVPSLTYQSGDTYDEINCLVKIQQVDFQQLKTVLQEHLPEQFSELQMDGSCTSFININGKLGKKKFPAIKVDFSMKDGFYRRPQDNIFLDKLSFNAKFLNNSSTDPKEFKFLMNEIKAKTISGSLQGSLEIDDFKNPLISADIHTSLKMDEVLSMWKIDTLEQISGDMDLKFNFQKKIKDFQSFTVEDFIDSKTEGELSLSDVAFALKTSPLKYENLRGKFFFNNNNLLVNNLEGQVSGSDFHMDGIFLNILSYWFMPGERLKIIADFNSKNLALDNLLENDSKQHEESYYFNLPEAVDCELNLSIDDLVFRKFNAKGIKGQLKLNNKKLILSNIYFESMGGQNEISGILTESKDHIFSIDCQATFGAVDIHQLFLSFEDFGQESFTHQHVRGSLTTDLFYKARMYSDLSFDISSHYVSADLVIADGEIIEYPPLYALANFIHVDKLQHVYFSELKNSIKIQDQLITIPDMEINSSTLHLQLDGIHTFSNEIDYHLLLRLSDLIKKPADVDDEILIKEEKGDHSYIPIRMTGFAEDPDIKYDWKGAGKRITDTWKEEKVALKQSLKKEINWIMGKEVTDTMTKDEKPNIAFEIPSVANQDSMYREKENNFEKNNADFIFIWDEEEDPDSLDMSIPDWE